MIIKNIERVLIIGMIFLRVFSAGAQNGLKEIVSFSDKARTTINFNRSWKFVLKDVEGAEKKDFNDASWETVGVPHSFSTPYFMSSEFYIGYGWYRKHFNIANVLKGKKIALEFEGVFQVAEVFVNGNKVGTHEGGYTGFNLDVTEYIQSGDNVVAVRVDNIWRPDRAPRAGEHVFSGGIYRDVRLVVTDPVHIDWYGTFITTPVATGSSAIVQVQTEVKNNLALKADVHVQVSLYDPTGKKVATINKKALAEPNQVSIVSQKSPVLHNPQLWHPNHPYLYRAITNVYVKGKKVDEQEQVFGIRSIRWTADSGFLLNGKRAYLRGANVHQDHAGWGDAVTNAGFYRDVKQMKDAGFNFIRGSHYPHDPSFADACDKLGMLFWSEGTFWGIGGSDRTPEGYWNSSAYPTQTRDTAGFHASVEQGIKEMIRINRNHPSIIVWSVSNEPFFTTKATITPMSELLKKLMKVVHSQDLTRPAAVGGCQRPIDSTRIDLIGDVAGYNGDGATIAAFLNPGIPSIVSEYGSVTADRPGKYEPGWVSLSADNGEDRHLWRAGQAIWCGFDHGSIAGANLGKMGIVDYFRLPKRAWYWYRNHYLGIAPPIWPEEGVPVALKLEADKLSAATDGTDDIWLHITILDGSGKPISNAPDVKLEIISGPGEFPTGRSVQFSKKSDIRILDGQAAISYRSWYAGKSIVRATSPGLKPSEITIDFKGKYTYQKELTPEPIERSYSRYVRNAENNLLQSFGRNNPTFASSFAVGFSNGYAADGDKRTSWKPASDDKKPFWTLDTEKKLALAEVNIVFPQTDSYQYLLQASEDGRNWKLLKDFSNNQQRQSSVKVELKDETARFIRVQFLNNNNASIADVEVLGKVI